jgi:hypothetical protein
MVVDTAVTASHNSHHARSYQHSMIPRPFLLTLVFALPILVVTFGVVLGASALARGLGDAAGAQGLFWFAVVALVLLVIDALLLLLVLGMRALSEEEEERRL